MVDIFFTPRSTSQSGTRIYKSKKYRDTICAYFRVAGRVYLVSRTWILLQFWQIVSDVSASGVYLLAEGDRTVVFHWASYEGRAGALHPTPRRYPRFKVQQHLLEELLTLHPALPEVSSRQERCHRLPVCAEEEQDNTLLSLYISWDNAHSVVSCTTSCLRFHETLL